MKARIKLRKRFIPTMPGEQSRARQLGEDTVDRLCAEYGYPRIIGGGLAVSPVILRGTAAGG